MAKSRRFETKKTYIVKDSSLKFINPDDTGNKIVMHGEDIKLTEAEALQLQGHVALKPEPKLETVVENKE